MPSTPQPPLVRASSSGDDNNNNNNNNNNNGGGGSASPSAAHPSATATSTPLLAPQPTIPNIPPRVASPANASAHAHAHAYAGESNVHLARSLAAAATTEDELAEQRRACRRSQHADGGNHNNSNDPSSSSSAASAHSHSHSRSRPSSTAPIEDSEVPTPQNPTDLDSVPISDEQKARIIERHLALPESSAMTFPSLDAGADGSGIQSNFSRHATQSPGPAGEAGDLADDSREYFVPHHMQGGAITEDIYRWAHQNRRRTAKRTRSESVHLPRTNTIDPDLDVEGIKEPGGFRRFFMLSQANRAGQPPPRALRSFIDFLSLYGHFAGEDLDDLDGDDDDGGEDDEDEDLEDQAAAATTSREAGTGQTERSTLLRRRPTARRQGTRGRSAGAKPRGEASVTEAVMMLLKSFVGTGILFLGKAFFNGGLLFSFVVLCAVAIISLVSFLLLVKAYVEVPASFGDMGGILYGPKMRLAILTSIVFSQLGFVAAYTVFVAQNLQAFVLGVTHCKTLVPTVYFILLQCAIFVPLSMVRKIAKLSSTALIADAFILFGIVYLFQYEIREIADRGVADVKMFNSQSFPLFIGTAVFTFEGVGLVIPITESMKEPERFPRALSWVMVGVMALFATSGALSYMAFGSHTQTVVITNLPQGSKFVQAMLFLYSLAILLSTPLQLFPAVTILERGLFTTRSGKYNTKVKLEKNLFRAGTVLVCCLAAWAGSSSLDVFVSFIGAVFCMPLCFLFPALLSLKARPNRTWAYKAVDVGILIFGVVAMLFAGSQTISTLFFGGGGGGGGEGGGDQPVCRPPPA